MDDGRSEQDSDPEELRPDANADDVEVVVHDDGGDGGDGVEGEAELGDGGDGDDGDDESDTDARARAAEARDPNILAEKQRMLAKLREWQASGAVKKVKRMTVRTAFDDVLDEYHRVCDLLGVADSDDEDGENDGDDDGEDDGEDGGAAAPDERSEEQLEADKQRMLGRLHGWWTSGTIKWPRRQVTDSSSYDDVAAVYDAACIKLGIVDDGAGVDATAETAAEAAAFIAAQEEAYKRKTGQPPPRGTVVGGRVLRDRAAIAKPVDAYYERFGAKEEAQLLEKVERTSMLKQLQKWAADGLYDPNEPPAVPLAALRRAPLATVSDEYERVADFLELESDGDESSSDDDNDDDDDDDDDSESGSDESGSEAESGDSESDSESGSESDSGDDDASGSESGSDASGSESDSGSSSSSSASSEHVGRKRPRVVRAAPRSDSDSDTVSGNDSDAGGGGGGGKAQTTFTRRRPPTCDTD